MPSYFYSDGGNPKFTKCYKKQLANVLNSSINIQDLPAPVSHCWLLN